MKTSDCYDANKLEELWEEFSDVPMIYNEEHEDGALETDWFIFEAGTDKLDIWHWFDEKYVGGVYKLMFSNDGIVK